MFMIWKKIKLLFKTEDSFSDTKNVYLKREDCVLKMDNNKDFADKIQYFAAGVLVILSTLVFTVLGAAAVKLLIWVIGL